MTILKYCRLNSKIITSRLSIEYSSLTSQSLPLHFTGTGSLLQILYCTFQSGENRPTQWSSSGTLHSYFFNCLNLPRLLKFVLTIAARTLQHRYFRYMLWVLEMISWSRKFDVRTAHGRNNLIFFHPCKIYCNLRLAAFEQDEGEDDTCVLTRIEMHHTSFLHHKQRFHKLI